MSITNPLQHAHRIVNAVQRGGGAHTSDVVANSWARCLKEYGLDPSRPRMPPRVSVRELPERQHRMAAVIDCARYEMTTLYQQLGDAESAVVLTDTDGVILHLVTSQEFERALMPLGLAVGTVWSEAEVGTNGMGTCAVENSPVVVQQADHFFSAFAMLTCSAVPIYDPSGELAAVLDVTSRSKLAQQHLLVLLGMTARMIENRLIDMRFRDALPILFHSRPEFVYTLHEGKLAVDGEGQILAANRSALLQLGVVNVQDLRGRRLDQIFQTTLDDMLERSHRAAFHPVVTYRANGPQRFFAVAREPAHDEGTSLPGSGSRPAPRQTLPHRRVQGSQAVIEHAPVQRKHRDPTFADSRLQNHLVTARRVIARGTPLLLRAETGAGKEVFARAVHAGSPRADGPFVAINCASLPDTLIEAELFGYRAGAFTGAEKTGRRGKILQADRGTLFLDEIGDMPLALQARLLRVLDERMVTPLGTDEPRPVDFQLISASHRHLSEMVGEGAFREDLYYRLAGIELQLPPLRERSDRAELIRNVLADEGRPDAPISPEAWDLLMSHPWPGNVRQLHHVLRSAVALADSGVLTLEHFGSLGASCQTHAPHDQVSGDDGPATLGLSPDLLAERQQLLDQLNALRWNVSHVAKALNISRNTLYRRMHKVHIPVTHSHE